MILSEEGLLRYYLKAKNSPELAKQQLAHIIILW